MNSACIKIKDSDLYFRGWDRYGKIVLKPEKQYANRMSRTLARRTIPKIEAEKGFECEIVTAE